MNLVAIYLFFCYLYIPPLRFYSIFFYFMPSYTSFYVWFIVQLYTCFIFPPNNKTKLIKGCENYIDFLFLNHSPFALF